MDEKVTREAARKHFNTTKDIRSLALSLAQSVSKVSAKAPFLTSESLVESFKTQEVDGKIQLLKGKMRALSDVKDRVFAENHHYKLNSCSIFESHTPLDAFEFRLYFIKMAPIILSEVFQMCKWKLDLKSSTTLWH